jgi:RNA polymerase sigma-70 factor, ECF subfamily
MYQPTNGNQILPFQGNHIDELFAQHYKALLRTAYRILRSKEDSEDAVQTAYGMAFQKFHSFRGASSLKTWVTRIVMNCCLMQLRARRARPQVSLEDIQPDLASEAATPETLCYRAELQATHARAVSKLSKGLRDVYAECVISGIAFPEVTQHLGLTPTAAKSRLFRARRRVEHSLQSAIQRRQPQ